jgi:hypothetical protein
MSEAGIPTNDIVRLQAKLDSLQRIAAAELERSRKKQKVSAIIGVALCVVCALALGNVTRLTFQLDANALSQIGRSEVERRLPEGRESAKSLLAAEAPRVVGSVIQGLIDTVPQFRQLIFVQLQDHGRTLLIELETRLLQELQQVIEDGRKRIDLEMPSAKPEEKIVRLTAIVADQFHGNMSEVIQALYPEYAREIERVRVYLEHLRTTDEARLTPKERTHKEIIRTMLRIAVREQTGHSITG